jgi:Ca2+-binding EF-hand superfamily protein
MKAHVLAAMVFVGAVALAGPGTARASAEPQTGQRTPMRFRAMDTNNDGVITRAEWRGNARSFRNHDWNNDGILSGDEVRIGAARQRADAQDDGFYEWTPAGFRTVDANRDNRITRNEWTYNWELFRRADRNRDNELTLPEFLGTATTDIDAEDRFADLDTNNNGSIERREWHGTLEAFRWLDRNNDGRLGRDETVENDAATGTSGRSRMSEEIVPVDARTRWTDTGVDVRAGDQVIFRADGTVSMSGNANDVADPAGSRIGRYASDVPLSQFPVGALIGRVGDSAPFIVGDRESFQVQDSGRLYLGINDGFLGDNSGQFRVSVSVRR